MAQHTINWKLFDRLKTQGLSMPRISAKMEIPLRTLERGVRARKQTQHGLSVSTPVQTAGQTPVHPRDTSAATSAESDEPVQTAVQSIDTGPVQSLDTGAVQRLDQLEEVVHRLAHVVGSLMEHVNQTSVQSPVQITALPPYPKAQADRWNIWLNRAIREEITTWAMEREISPSQLVQELLWKALNDRSVAMP
jgi:hypothetical protein